MKIALAQLNFTVGDIKTNTAKIVDAIKRAKNEGADLVVFAEFMDSFPRQHSSPSVRRR